jgi:septum formation protein
MVRVTGLKLDAAVARHARRQLAQAPILCSDTTVALGTQILGKPADAADADRMLRQLAGQTHEVLTAVALQHGGQRRAALSISQVTFAAMTDAQIAAYVASGEPMGKAGSYGIQGGCGACGAHGGQLFGHHGSAGVRDRTAAAAGGLAALNGTTAHCLRLAAAFGTWPVRRIWF